MMNKRQQGHTVYGGAAHRWIYSDLGLTEALEGER